MKRVKLQAARYRKGLSQEALAEAIGVGRTAISEWENGHTTPHPVYIGRLCAFFGVDDPAALDVCLRQDHPPDPVVARPTPTEPPALLKVEHVEHTDQVTRPFPVSSAPLEAQVPDGQSLSLLPQPVVQEEFASLSLHDLFVPEITSGDCATWFSERLVHIVAFVMQRQRHIRATDFEKIVNRELRVLDETKTMFDPDAYFLSRRNALLVIAALPKGLLGLLPQSKTAFIEEEFLPTCAASITACWYLLNGKEFESVERAVSRYLPYLILWVRQVSSYQKTAAYLVSQVYMLLSLVASHRLWTHQRVAYCEEAVTYATHAEDPLLLIKAFTMLGNALYDQKRYDEMLQCYQQAEALLNSTQYAVPNVLRGKVLMGIAHAYAQRGSVKEALNAMSEAQEYFPGAVEDIPVFLSADDGLFSLILFEGWVRLDLGRQNEKKEHYECAAQALARIEALPRTLLVPERIRLEITNRRAQAAIALGDLEAFCHFTLESAQGLQSVASEKRRQELIVNYKEARGKWPHEAQVRALADVLL